MTSRGAQPVDTLCPLRPGCSISVEHDPPAPVNLSFYGLGVSVSGQWSEVIDDLRDDFSWFETSNQASAAVMIAVEHRAPDFEAAGELEAAFVTPRNVVYQHRDRAVIDYSGKALSIYERSGDRLLVQGEDRDLVHEAAYLFILSRVGRHLEAVGLPRLHALGLSGPSGGVAVMLPSGGGKSTLAISALRADGVKLLSEDSPLIDRHGVLHPFPLRLGVNESDAQHLPNGRTRTLKRMEFGPKTVLDLETVADRIESQPQPLRHLVLGQRTLGRHARLEPVARRKLAGPLVRECVVGVGIYQGMEFILQRGMRDLTRSARPAMIRAACSAVALATARTWHLRLGRDHEANWSALTQLLD
jgi:hypothetical protein